jgi:hypothetical protein
MEKINEQTLCNALHLIGRQKKRKKADVKQSAEALSGTDPNLLLLHHRLLLQRWERASKRALPCPARM